MKRVLSIPANGSYSETLKLQQQALKESENLILHELEKKYDKGYQDATKFYDEMKVRKQQKEN
ncbi:hypothetical protein [Epilithonimonas arachidiradicis]|nr:hypothetical protein [Epilithonimonas arachidiradicis]